MFARRASGCGRQVKLTIVGKATYHATPCSLRHFYGVRHHKQCNYANRISDEPNNARQQYAKCTFAALQKTNRRLTASFTVPGFTVIQTSYTLLGDLYGPTQGDA
jgi:hypothetical protein